MSHPFVVEVFDGEFSENAIIYYDVAEDVIQIKTKHVAYSDDDKDKAEFSPEAWEAIKKSVDFLIAANKHE